MAVARGKLYVVGIGPGGPQHRTYRAVEAIAESCVVVGHSPYLDAIADLTAGKLRVASGMDPRGPAMPQGIGTRRGGRRGGADFVRATRGFMAWLG